MVRAIGRLADARRDPRLGSCMARVYSPRPVSPPAHRARGRRPACGSACRGSGSRRGRAVPRWHAWPARRSAARAGGGRRPSPASRRRRSGRPRMVVPPDSTEPEHRAGVGRHAMPHDAAAERRDGPIERVVGIGAGAARGQDDVDRTGARASSSRSAAVTGAELVGDVDRRRPAPSRGPPPSGARWPRSGPAPGRAATP